jgi:uncharacterized protein YceH (UPF0502 family)
MDADAVEIRVLGCLIEKQRTTPDAYPLSLNSLRLACNQATNRDPVVAYEEREIKAALDRMSNRGWTRFASGASSRALKYRHLLDEALQLSGPEVSLLGVLMLRGAQTVGELKQRSERLHRFETIAEVAETLDVLSQRELVERLERRPGQKEERWRQLLGDDSSEAIVQSESQESQPRGDDRVTAIEERLERLERAFDDLLTRLDKVPDRE